MADDLVIDIKKQISKNKELIKSTENLINTMNDFHKKHNLSYEHSVLFIRKLNPNNYLLKKTFSEIENMQKKSGHKQDKFKNKDLMDKVLRKKTI